MKALVQNYSSEITSEPLYFNQTLYNCGIESSLWSNEYSAFDIFDLKNPDIFITNFQAITHDIVKRLKDTKIKVAINVNGANEAILNGIKKLPFKTYTFQNFDLSNDNTVVPIAADIFLSQRKINSINYNIDTLYIVQTLEDLEKIKNIKNKPKSYHIVGTMANMRDLPELDMILPIGNIFAFYKNYKNIVCFTQTQIQYDSAFYGDSCQTSSGVITKKQIIDKFNPYKSTHKLFSLLESGTEILEKIDAGYENFRRTCDSSLE